MASTPPEETDRFPEPGLESVAPGPDSAAHERGRLALERLLGAAGAPSAPPPFAGARPPGAGDEVGGVVLGAVLGRGGMGVVWRGHDPRLGRDVAVKLLGRSADQDALARFRLEAEATARLRHPHVVGVHAAGALRGWPWLVMDLVEGESLARRLDREPGRRLAPRAAVELARPLADALAHAHAQGVVHRDVKPANVLLDASGPRLVDFGLARDLHRDARLTPSGVVVGTPAYMAPEQLVGGAVDGRADVWGLGATLHELLTGQPPFAGHTGAALLGAVRRGPTPPSDQAPLVDAGLDRLVRACLAPDPDDRYPSAAALRDDLDRWLAGERLRPPGRRRGRRPVLAGAALAAGLVAGLLLLPALRRAEAPAPAAATATRPQGAAVTSRALTELERLILEAPRGDPDALRRLASATAAPSDPVPLLADLLLGGPAPRSRIRAALGDGVPAVARDLELLEERVLALEGWRSRGLDAAADVRSWWRLVRRLEALPTDGPVGPLVRRRAQRLLGRALPALYLQLGRSVIAEPLLPLVQAVEALGADASHLLPMRAWLLFMDLATRDAPTPLRALLAPELLPADLPRWQRTLVEAMRLVVRRSRLSAAAAAKVHDELVDYAWRDASLVVVWVQREVGRLYREEAMARYVAGAPTAPASDDVLALRALLKEAVDWGTRACVHDPTGQEGAELVVTLLASTDWSAARDLTAGLLVDPAVQVALQAEVDLAAVSAEEALAWLEANLQAGHAPAARATLRLARAHVRSELGQDYEEDLAAAAALLGDAPPALDIPWLRDVEKTRELCQGHAWWPGDLRHR